MKTRAFVPLYPIIIVAIAISLLLGACGPSATQEPAPAATEKPAAATPVKEEPAAGTVLGGETIRLLFVGDPFANALQSIVADIEKQAGGKIQLEIVPYDAVHQKILLNAQNTTSAYDVVSVDIVWMGEFGSGNVLLPLDDYIAKTDIDVADFPEGAWRGAQYKGKQMAIPIQPHPEILAYRTDLFEKDGLAPPETTEDVLAAAKHFNDPANNMYGVCWNGARGQALGQQMAHFYAAFNQKLFDDTYHPLLDSPGGLRAAKYALALMEYSPPDILNMAWDERVRQFAQGGCAMTYIWAGRSFMVEDSTSSKVAGKVGYVGAPHASDAPPVTPNGEWTLAIPNNIGDRADLAWRFVAWLTSPEQLKTLAKAGNSGMPRYSIIRDPELVKLYPVFPAVDKIASAGQLQDWMRPNIPEWPVLADTLGTVFHEMLSGSLTPEEACQKAQGIMDEVMKQGGYY